MKLSHFGAPSIRAVLAVVLAVVLSACGGSDYVTPITGAEIRPLSPEFTTRKAVNYSPYRTATSEAGLAAEVITKANIRQDLDLIVAAGFRLIRLFDSSDKVARQTLEVIRDHQLNLKVQLGAYVHSGQDGASRAELARCVALAKEFEDIVLAVSVGNETMVSWSFNKIDPELMADYIRTVRGQIKQPVTTDDNYAFWASAPLSITNAVDFVSLHTYAELDTVFNPTLWDWRQRDVEEGPRRAVAMMDAAIAETRRQYDEARSFLDRRGLTRMPITIGETGWNAVNVGRLRFRAHPVNQKMYLDRLAAWAAEGRAGAGPKAIFYFEAFDEPWKQGDDKWGLFNKDRQARYAIQTINANNSPAGSATWVWEPGSYTDADAEYFKRAKVNDPITVDRYTLYSDNALGASEVRPTGLFWDAFDGTTAAGPEVMTAHAPGDAARSLEITPKPAAYGWGFLRQPHSEDTENLKPYEASGTLNFWISTTYPGKIEIGISSDTQDREPQEAFLQIQPGNYGYCNTGAWCRVSIPLKDFVAKNPKLDLSLVLIRFAIADVYARTGNAPGSTAKLYIDGIAWVK